LLLTANLLFVGLVNCSELLSAPYERTLYRYELLFGSPVDEEEPKTGQGGDAQGQGDQKKVAGGKAKRLEEFEFAWDRSVQDPVHFLIGHGFGSFNLIKYGKDGRGYPHNIFLEVLFELGAIGVLLALAFFVTSLHRAYRNGHYLFLMAILFFLLNTMKSYSVVDLRLLFGLLAVAAFIPPKGERGIFRSTS
jgi:hypothetical protein